MYNAIWKHQKYRTKSTSWSTASTPTGTGTLAQPRIIFDLWITFLVYGLVACWNGSNYGQDTDFRFFSGLPLSFKKAGLVASKPTAAWAAAMHTSRFANC
jgi:hypothetical protein